MDIISGFQFLYSVPWLSSDKDIVDLILAIIQGLTLIFLVIYVKKTWDMAVSTEDSANVSKLTLLEMKETRDQEISPYVVAYFEVEDFHINLVIENVGKGLAKDVKINISPELQSSRGREINDLPLIKDGIASMPPKYKIKTHFDTTINYFNAENNFPLKYDAQLTYYGGINETKRVTNHVLDINSYYKIRFIDKKGIHELVKEIQEIKKAQNSIKNDFGKFNKNFSRGIWIKNPQKLITNSCGSNDKESIIAKLNEFKNLWESVYLKVDEDIDPFNTDIRNSFSSIGMHILILSSYDIIPEELNSILLDIGTKIMKLGRCDDFWKQMDFNSLGNEITDLIKEIIEKLNE